MPQIVAISKKDHERMFKLSNSIWIRYDKGRDPDNNNSEIQIFDFYVIIDYFQIIYNRITNTKGKIMEFLNKNKLDSLVAFSHSCMIAIINSTDIY